MLGMQLKPIFCGEAVEYQTIQWSADTFTLDVHFTISKLVVIYQLWSLLHWYRPTRQTVSYWLLWSIFVISFAKYVKFNIFFLSFGSMYYFLQYFGLRVFSNISKGKLYSTVLKWFQSISYAAIHYNFTFIL